MTVPIEQAQVQLAELIGRMAAGEQIVITVNGSPAATLMPAPVAGNGNGSPSAGGDGGTAGETPHAPRRLGWGKDLITYMADDFDAPLEEFREYME